MSRAHILIQITTINGSPRETRREVRAGRGSYETWPVCIIKNVIKLFSTAIIKDLASSGDELSIDHDRAARRTRRYPRDPRSRMCPLPDRLSLSLSLASSSPSRSLSLSFSAQFGRNYFLVIFHHASDSRPAA